MPILNSWSLESAEGFAAAQGFVAAEGKCGECTWMLRKRGG
jgi:hypothetical protein